MHFTLSYQAHNRGRVCPQQNLGTRLVFALLGPPYIVCLALPKALRCSPAKCVPVVMSKMQYCCITKRTQLYIGMQFESVFRFAAKELINQTDL